MNIRSAVLTTAITLLLAGAPSAVAAALPVYDARHGLTSSPEAMFDAAAGADVVFVGEQHGDRAAHQLQLELLQALAERGRPVVLVMEMFERDVQPALDDYLAGRIDEARMLEFARPWPNYHADYRPLVEFARARGWRVAAGNAPRPLAALIAREGLAALEAVEAAERSHVAAQLQCGDGAYRDKFMDEMRGMLAHHSPSEGGAANLDRLYEAQCAKGETMAESAAAHLAPGTTVVHLNGAFHSDDGLGAVERLVRRRPDAQVLVISIVRGGAPRPSQRSLGDFVVWTP